MPPKAKLHKNTGKSNFQQQPPQLPTISSESPSTSTSISPELEQQFEIELCWCIQQLQKALKSGKLNQKQIQDHTKSLNSLMSNNAPMIKKRQIMRLSFGDYRAKMQEEDKKISRGINIKVTSAKPSTKSVFVKKSIFLNNTGSTFKFDFEPPEQNSTKENSAINYSAIEEKDNIECNNKKSESDKFHFNLSHNEFRFNFDSHY